MLDVTTLTWLGWACVLGSVAGPAVGFGNGMESLTPSIFAEVLAASTGDETRGVVLDVRDYGEILASDVQKFRR